MSATALSASVGELDRLVRTHVLDRDGVVSPLDTL